VYFDVKKKSQQIAKIANRDDKMHSAHQNDSSKYEKHETEGREISNFADALQTELEIS
jgi:hypothetical protein